MKNLILNLDIVITFRDGKLNKLNNNFNKYIVEKNHVKFKTSIPIKKKFKSKFNLPKYNKLFMCQLIEPTAIVEFSIKKVKPHFSKKYKLKQLITLKSDKPPDLSIIKPNQENVNALLQQTKINKNKDSSIRFKLMVRIT